MLSTEILDCMQAWRSTKRLVALLALACASLASHADAVTQLGIGATVQPMAIIKGSPARPEISISAADIARGSIDIPASVQLEVRSNTPAGYVLNIAPRVALFTRAQIVGLDAAIEIGPDGASVVQRGSYLQFTRIAMGYRFFLVPGLQPGSYPWPLQLSVEPLLGK